MSRITCKNCGEKNERKFDKCWNCEWPLIASEAKSAEVRRGGDGFPVERNVPPRKLWCRECGSTTIGRHGMGCRIGYERERELAANKGHSGHSAAPAEGYADAAGSAPRSVSDASGLKGE